MLDNYDFWESNPYFDKSEFTCKCGCGHNNISHVLITCLSNCRDTAKTPFIINSACRCENHNKKEHGSVNSSHLKGLAADIFVGNSVDRYKILESLILFGVKRIGVYENFIHVDIDDTKTQNVIWYK